MRSEVIGTTEMLRLCSLTESGSKKMILEYSGKDLVPKYVHLEKYHRKFIIPSVLKVHQHVIQKKLDLRAYIYLNYCKLTPLSQYKIIFHAAVGDHSAAFIWMSK